MPSKRSSSTSARSRSSSSKRASSRGKADAIRTTDHDEIREWVEQRGGHPACVRGTGGGEDIGMLRIDFPGYSGKESLEEIGWEDFFDKFDERKLAFLHQDQTRGGQRSNFNKLISQSDGARTRKARGGSNRAAGSKRRASGSKRSRAAGRRSSTRRAAGRASSAAHSRSGMRAKSRSSTSRRGSSTGRRKSGRHGRSAK